MTLPEVYFYMIIIVCLVFSFLIIYNLEDIKDDKQYKKFFKISFLLGFVGVIMELLNWNYLCQFQCILLTFSPFISLSLVKLTLIFFRKFYQKEPHKVYRGELRDGFWVKNQGDIKHLKYYNIYSIVSMYIPTLVLMILFILIEENLC